MSKQKHWRAKISQKPAMRGPRSKKVLYVALPLLAITLLILGGCGATQPEQEGLVTPEGIAAEIIPQEGDPTSYGIPIALSNTQRFINFYDSITLTREQEITRRDALQPLKAPCCDDNSMYNC